MRSPKIYLSSQLHNAQIFEIAVEYQRTYQSLNKAFVSRALQIGNAAIRDWLRMSSEASPIQIFFRKTVKVRRFTLPLQVHDEKSHGCVASTVSQVLPLSCDPFSPPFFSLPDTAALAATLVSASLRHSHRLQEHLLHLIYFFL
jgi:hypothetical protein